MALTRLTILLVALSTSGASLSHDLRPNIILIVADYMGYADIEPYGATDIDTPSLTALAQEGIRYSNHYSAAPVCIPARASLLSGLYPTRALTRFPEGSGSGLRAADNALLSHLKPAGYRSAMIGKWHLGTAPGFSPNDHGFDHFFGFDSWTLNPHNHNKSDGVPGLLENGTPTSRSGYLTDLLTDEAVRFIAQASTGPFFLYLSYNGGLPPYQAPELPRSDWQSGWDAHASTRADYIAMIERMDRGIGRVLDALQFAKQADNTLVIFTYDHGGRHLVDSGPLFHGFATLWEGGIRVPLIMRWPRVLPDQGTVDTPTIGMDITATILDAAGTREGIPALDGRSLLMTAKQPALSERDLFWKFGRMSAVRRGDWKYLADGDTQFLFNLQDDISERRNLFANYPDRINDMRRALAEWSSGQ